MCLLCWFFFFFFKQKTAYEMRISDWSSDVCSSDLGGAQSAADSQSCVQPYARDLAAARCAGVARGGRESAARGAGGTRRHAAARHPYHYFAGRPGADTAVLPAGAAALLPAGAPAPRPHAAVGRQPADPLRRLPRRIEDVLPAADPAGPATLGRDRKSTRLNSSH